MEKKMKFIRVTEADYGTWELVKEHARKKAISVSEYVLRACFNEVHEDARLEEAKSDRTVTYIG